MWFDPLPDAPDWSKAEQHLSKADPKLAAVIRQVGPCQIKPLPDPYLALVLSIFSQQLSFKGAETLYAKFRGRFSKKTPTPRKVLSALSPSSDRVWDDEVIRSCGISRQKRSYMIDLSQRIVDGRLKLDELATLSDEEVIAKLVEVKGIGVWTAHMYLLFVLLRGDVLPVGDLGLREGFLRVFRLDERPDEATMQRLAEPWHPWCSVATWYLWKAKGD
ncbi:MAG: DNA-3-methyladenine glycosylase 2 family protein [Planctomycetota bacterium]